MPAPQEASPVVRLPPKVMVQLQGLWALLVLRDLLVLQGLLVLRDLKATKGHRV